MDTNWLTTVRIISIVTVLGLESVARPAPPNNRKSVTCTKAWIPRFVCIYCSRIYVMKQKVWVQPSQWVITMIRAHLRGHLHFIVLSSWNRKTTSYDARSMLRSVMSISPSGLALSVLSIIWRPQWTMRYSSLTAVGSEYRSNPVEFLGQYLQNEGR